MSNQVLSEAGTDRVFKSLHDASNGKRANVQAKTYDFRRPDRVAKDHLRSIQSLHEQFTRSFGSSLSGYLRTFVAINIISVEQSSFSEILRVIESPTTIVPLRIQPIKGTALVEMRGNLVFPVIEMLLGGTARTSEIVNRETTEIERSILDGVLRLMMRDLHVSWLSIADIDFEIESYMSVPQAFQLLPPNEAMLAIGMEVEIGDHRGILNLWIPSIVIKMLRQKATSTSSARKTQSGEAEQKRMLNLVKSAHIGLDFQLNGPKMLLKDLIAIEPGDVIALDHPVAKPIDLLMNKALKFNGHIVSSGNKRALQIAKRVEEVS